MMKSLCPILNPVLIPLLVLASLPVVVAPQAASASGLVSTEEALEAERADADRERIHEVLSREDVQEELLARGVEPEAVEARVAALSEEEAHQLANQLDELPAGASVGAVVGVLFLVFAILLVTDILGLTDVYPFTR